MKTKTVIKGKKYQQLNQREAKLINDLTVQGLLLFDVDQRNSGVKLFYNTTSLVSLSEFLQMNEMSKRLFIVMMRNIVLILKAVAENHFSKNLIMWTLKSAYIDPATWHLYLMYVPLQPYETTGNLKSFLLDIISSCSFIPGENVDYVQMLVKEMNSGVSYTPYMLEDFCNKVSEELSSTYKREQIQCPSCKSKLTADENVCPFCGAKLRNNTFQGQHNISHSSDNDYFKSNDTNDTENEQQNSRQQGDISIGEDENGVVTVFRKPLNGSHNVWLEDQKRYIKIAIVKFPFRLGKMDGVTDYRIFSNKVSRKHADILKEQEKYYIVDLGSTNGTFLDGKRIQPGVKEELVDGSHLKFADEEFTFNID